MLNILVAMGTFVPMFLWISFEVVIYSRKISRHSEKPKILSNASDMRNKLVRLIHINRYEKSRTPVIRLTPESSKPRESLTIVKSELSKPYSGNLHSATKA